MKRSESLMTIIALLIGLSLTLALIFLNFSLVFTLKLFREGSVPAGRYLFMLSITAVNIGLMVWLGKVLKIAQRPVKKTVLKPRPHPKDNSRTLILDFMQQWRRFRLQDLLHNTGLDAIETGYVLDELLHAGYLEVQESHGEFFYQVTEKPLVPMP